MQSAVEETMLALICPCRECGKRETYAKGVCMPCYQKARRRAANPTLIGRRPNGHDEQLAMLCVDQWIARFHESVDITDECHWWTSTIGNGGYGMIWAGAGMRLAHRLAFLLAGGQPGAEVVMHTCDNPLCVNPAHLRAGTYKENMQDMAAKGRSTRGRKRAA